jgi:hypothetical protein
MQATGAMVVRVLMVLALLIAPAASAKHADAAAELASGFEKLKREIHTLPLPEAKKRLDALRALGVAPPHQVSCALRKQVDMM